MRSTRKRQLLIAAALGAICLVPFGDAAPPDPQGAMTTAVPYRVVPLPPEGLSPERLAARLNQEWESGWEFVAFLPDAGEAAPTLLLRLRERWNRTSSAPGGVEEPLLWLDFDPTAEYLLINGAPVLAGGGGLSAALRRYGASPAVTVRLRREVPPSHLVTVLAGLRQVGVLEITLQFPDDEE